MSGRIPLVHESDDPRLRRRLAETEPDDFLAGIAV